MDASSIPATSGIYRITNTVNGKFYLGSTINLCQRWGEHRRQLRAGRHSNKKLQHAWNKYTESAFHFEVIEFVLSPFLIEREQYWLDKLHPTLNIARSAQASQLGIKRSPETLAKFSAARRGKPGKKLSPEARENLRLAKLGNTYNRGRKFSPEHRQHIGQSLLGNTNGLGHKRSPEAIEKARLANLGHEVSPETRKKLRAASLGNTNAHGAKRSTEYREKMRHARLGKKHTDESDIG